MAATLSQPAFEHAQQLIRDGRVVIDEGDDRSEHQPSAEDENRFIAEYGFGEYAKWHLGVDDEEREQTKARYTLPDGDFERVHRCALLAAESRAGQYDYDDIERAVAHLHGRLEAIRAKAR
jgi:hypothetical protein